MLNMHVSYFLSGTYHNINLNSDRISSIHKDASCFGQDQEKYSYFSQVFVYAKNRPLFKILQNLYKLIP